VLSVSTVIKSSLQLLQQARIANIVYSTAGNGVPLGGELNRKYFKVNLLDTGLVSSLLDLRYTDVKNIRDINLINKGAVAEQVVGQLLRCNEKFYKDPSLFYWIREQRNANAEID